MKIFQWQLERELPEDCETQSRGNIIETQSLEKHSSKCNFPSTVEQQKSDSPKPKADNPIVLIGQVR